MSQVNKTQGLTCPNCNGIVAVPEGVRVVQCPYCQMYSLVQGERGVRRWQVERKIDRPEALTAVRSFFSGLNRAQDLKQKATIRELFLVYLPYWRVQALVVGWMLGRVRKDKDSTRPVEVEIVEEMTWNDAAVAVAEFGVEQVTVSRQALLPYNQEELQGEGMVFDPSESPTDALAEAEQHFIYRGRNMRSLSSKFFEKFHILHPQLAIVYYPLWVARYDYRQRSYQVVVDGVGGKVLYGKAPGNIFYRAAMLVAGMALGNFVLINGTIIAGLILAAMNDDDTPVWLILLPIVFGIALIVLGYQSFRYGEEVQERPKENRKAALASDKQQGNWMKTGMEFVDELSEMVVK